MDGTLYLFVWGFLALGAVNTVGMIGKERKTITPGIAVAVIIIQGLLAVGAYLVR